MDFACDIIKKGILFGVEIRWNRNEKRRKPLAETREKVSGSYLEYRGWPLVREENTIIYGDMSEKCILILEIMSYGANNLPDKILIQVVDSKDPNKILRQGAKNGLYEAFSLGVVWLDHECRKDAE